MAGAFPHLDVAGAECLRTLRPGSRYVCFYDDDEVWHERYALWPANQRGTSWFVITPDLDVYEEKLDHSDADDGPRLLRPVKADGKLPALNRQCYRFDAALDDPEIRRHVRSARAQAQAAGFAGVPDEALDTAGRVVPLAGYLGAAPARRLVGKQEPDAAVRHD